MEIVKLLRVHQWVKNFFVFLPLFFSGRVLEQNLFLNALWAFFLFSLAASFIYVINDYRDIEKDKLHEVKRLRPLASGKISKSHAVVIAILLLVLLGLGCAFLFSPIQLIPLLVYIVLNLAYSWGLKNVAIVDVSIIAIGFVLRVLFGGITTGVVVSKWAFLLTFALALVLALGKRRGELMSTKAETRKALKGYNLQFIDTALVSSVTIVIVCYIMYSVSPEIAINFNFEYVYATAFFVILGIFRYLQQTYVFNRTESPTQLVFKDHFLQLVIVLWILTFAGIIYFR
ncbi:UbiA prenyltransferase family protein [Aureitalea sp. L0-47]|nr:UbiA prenyltransferase family protein [Aureitalea sp. L0-47]MCW5519864.1 UbiA prenyltransferase family protein [Aureitalea sp. L0-47]